MVDRPRTLLQAVAYFQDENNCIKYLAAKRWPNGVVSCPTCGGNKVSYLENQKRWQCSARHLKRQFSVKVGTIMQDSPIGLDVLENFWSLLKRDLSGTYVSVEPFHLFRYLDEQAFRYNHRKERKLSKKEAQRQGRGRRRAA